MPRPVDPVTTLRATPRAQNMPRQKVPPRAYPGDGRQRVVVEDVRPEIDGGRFAIKRTVGEEVVVEADVFADGHDVLRAVILHRRAGVEGWTETPMSPLGNDRWRGEFAVGHLGVHEYTILAWVDRFGTWRRDLRTRVGAASHTDVDLLIGARLIEEAAAHADADDRAQLEGWALDLRGDAPLDGRAALALDDDLAALMTRHEDRRHATRHPRVLQVIVEPVRARYSSWYELFPRSTSPDQSRAGTLRDVIGRLPYVADLGFDVLYLPPIHPIGRMFRKGPNNSTRPRPTDPGVPWAIGAAEGGHTAIHPDLGTLDDFRALVAAADRLGIAIALDLAYQASPDHPWVREHPTWFRQRPDGTVQYAENPPKKYQDVYPFDFESEDWEALWAATLEIVRFWIDQGVRIFRVDNPHTKPFAFWEWLIGEIRRVDPDVLFLAEAFTRPKVMYRLGKLGFSQSYTYFTWRTTKDEIADYFTELTQTEVREFFRPNVWPNTPDILHEFLQHGGRPAFELRFVLAATLAASYGIYGPAFELGEHLPREAGSEEYLDSEKYQVRHWDLEQPGSIAPLIRRVNEIRDEHPALQSNERLAFHPIDSDELIAWSKRTADGSDVILTVVNLDPYHRHAGLVELPLDQLGIDPERPFDVVDLLTGTTYLWHGSRNYVELDPAIAPAHVFQVHPRARTELEFDYY